MPTERSGGSGDGGVASPAAAALAAGIARLEPDGSVVFAPPSDEPVAAQREAGPAEAGAAPAAASGAPAAGTAPPSGGTQAGATPAAMSSEQLEVLAKQLYDRIRERFRTELRIDRERWGRLTDLAR